MNQKVRSNYQHLAQGLGLRLDEVGGALYGTWGTYPVAILAPNESYPYSLVVTISAVRAGSPLSREEGKQFRREHKPAVQSLTQQGSLLTMGVKPSGRMDRLQEYLGSALEALTGYLRAAGFHPCCQSCGRTVGTDACSVGGSYVHLCPDCFTAIQQDHTRMAAVREQKPENVVAGIVGAVLGSLVGVLCIILLSQLGYVAALSGLVMAVGTLKGYERFSGRMSRKGIVICLVLMLVMTYVGDQADWAIIAMRDLDLDFFTAFRAIPLLRELGAIEAANYWTNLVMLYAFVLLGAIPTTLAAVKSQRSAGVVYRAGSTRDA